MPDSNKVISAKARERGNAEFARGHWSKAVISYIGAIDHDPLDDKPWSNRALAHIKLEQWELAEFSASTALSLGATGKARYRRALARHKLGHHQAAKRDLSHLPKSELNKLDEIHKLRIEVDQAMLAQPPPAAIPSVAVPIDHSAYPHIIESIVCYSDPQTRIALRQTCKALDKLIRKANCHLDIVAPPGAIRQHIQFQPQPMGRTFCSWRKDQVPPRTPEARKEETYRQLVINDCRRFDLCGLVDTKLLDQAMVMSNTVRIRKDRKGHYANRAIDLARHSMQTVVVFPTAHRLPIKGRRKTDGHHLYLSQTVTRVVYPLVWGSVQQGISFAVHLPAGNGERDPPTAFTAMETYVDDDYNPELDIVIICPTVESTQQTIWPTLECGIANEMLTRIDLVILAGIRCGARSVKIVNLSGILLMLLHGRHGKDAPTPSTLWGDEAKRQFHESQMEDHIRKHLRLCLSMLSGQHQQSLPDWMRGGVAQWVESRVNKLRFLTINQYRATLNPGEWEEQTVEYLNGFM